MSSDEKDNDHGKWTYHEYVTNGQHGYIISGGLLPDDDAVNRKARELGFPIHSTKWTRVPIHVERSTWVASSSMATRYLYHTEDIDEFAIDRERQSIGAFYDLRPHVIDAQGKIMVLSAFIGSQSVFSLVSIAGPGLYCLLGLVPSLLLLCGLISLSGMSDNPYRIIDDSGSSIMNAPATPLHVLLSITARRVLRSRLHVPVSESPKGWRRIAHGDAVVYAREHAGTPTAVSGTEALDIISNEEHEYNYAYHCPRIVSEANAMEPSAATVTGALRSIVGPSVIPSAAGALNVDQSRAVMARLRARVPEK